MKERQASFPGLRSLLPREQWRRNQLAVTVAAAMVFLGFTLVMPFLPFYVESLGIVGMPAIALWSGIFLTVSPLLAALLGPFWGRLADRVGMRVMVHRVLLTITLHWGLMYFATNVWQVLGLRVLLGLFSGFGTMSVALVTLGCPQESIGRAVGRLQATQILSTAIGPFLGGVLAQTIGIRSTYVVTFMLCAAALGFVILLYRDAPVAESVAPSAPEPPIVVAQEGPVSAGVRAVVPPARGAAVRPGVPRPGIREILALPSFLPLVPLLFCLNMVDRALFLNVPMFVADLAGRRQAEAAAGIVVSAGALAGAASAYVLGRRSRWASPMTLLLLGMAASTVSLVLMALCRSLLPFFALRILLGLSVGGAATLIYTQAGSIIPARVRATGYSILSSAAMLGGAAGPVLCGFLASHSIRAPFVAGGMVYAAMTAHAAALARRAAAPAVAFEGEAPAGST